MNWFKVTKSFQGGTKSFQIRVPAKVKDQKDWKAILDWLGEHTDGGHNYGWSIKARKLPKKSPTLKVVTYPNYLCPILARYGSKVVTEQRMI